jgi:hypothetical protein
MSATSSTFASFKPLPQVPRLESGKPVESVNPLRAAPGRQPKPLNTISELPREPEDARITGGTRSLDRRLLALNLSRPRTTAA